MQEETGTGGWFSYLFALRDLEYLSCSCLLTPYTWQKNIYGNDIPAWGDTAQVKIKKIKFEVKSFWKGSKPKLKPLNPLNLFHSPFYSPKELFLRKKKTFKFSAQVGAEEQPMHLYGLGLHFPRVGIKVICCIAQNQQDTDHLQFRSLPWQHQSLAFWDVQR